MLQSSTQLIDVNLSGATRYYGNEGCTKFPKATDSPLDGLISYAAPLLGGVELFSSDTNGLLYSAGQLGFFFLV